MLEQVAESGTRMRTRRAILDAAIRVLGQRSGATLAEVAEAAEVGRTTLHRYFPERSHLLDAISAHGLEQIATATEQARLHEGSGREALLRLCRELFDLGDLFLLLFNDPQFAQRPEWRDTGEIDADMQTLVERGHTDGTINRDLSPLWVQTMLWCMLYAAFSHVAHSGGSRHDALAMALTSLAGAVSPQR